MKIELDVEIPEGYEATGKYGKPVAGEYWMDIHGKVFSVSDTGNRIILRKKKPEPPKFFIRKNSICVERKEVWINNFWFHRSDIPKIIEALEHCADWIDEHGEKCAA